MVTISPEYYLYNILNELENSSYNQRGSALSVTANLQFSLINWLKANVIASYQTSNTIQESWWGEQTNYAAKLRGTEYGVLPAPRTEGEPDYLGNPTYTGGTSLLPYGGELSHNQSDNHSYTVRLQLDGNYSFGKSDQHNINGSIGFEMSSKIRGSRKRIPSQRPRRSVNAEIVDLILWPMENPPWLLLF